MVRKGGLEPPRSCDRQPLKLVRLPIPPLPHEREFSVISSQFSVFSSQFSVISCRPSAIGPQPCAYGLY